MDGVGKHIHTGGVSILVVLAIVGAAHFLIRTYTAKHADSAWAQGLSFLY